MLVAMSRHGERIFSGYVGRTLRILREKNGDLECTSVNGHKGGVGLVKMTSDKTFIVARP